MADKYATQQAPTSPALDAFAITPSDSTDFAQVTRGVYVGGAGDVAAVMSDGTVVTFVGALAGSVLPIRAKRVNSTNTTATSLVGLY